MKRFICDFIHRGLIAGSFGPIILAIAYACIQADGIIHTLTVNEVVLGIFTSELLAFIAGGINAIYKIERLPLIFAIFIHGIILYIDYVVIYLVNDWMKAEFVPLAMFTVCFFAGFAIVWAMIYVHTKRSADRLNRKLEAYQKRVELDIPGECIEKNIEI